ncbi:MAG: hypothetical protein ACI4SP_02385, partial [Eubacteriales bacterium]
MKNTVKIACLLLALCLACVCLASCQVTTPDAETLSYISMRINPEIELVVDQEGIVVSANAVNEDGETVLCELDLVGMTVEDAGEAFTAAATELGFVDVDGETTVYISADGEDETFTQELEEKLEKKIHDFFDKKGIVGKVSPEDLEEYQAMAEEWGVSPREAKLVARILELYPDMTAEDVLALTFEERIALIRDEHKNNGNMTAGIHAEYREAVEELKEQYPELFTLEEQLREFGRQLTNPELTEEERTALTEQFETLKATYRELKEQFKTEAEALREQLKEAADAE